VAFGPGRTGLIGVNGAGKSTLLRLLAGRLLPSRGSLTVTGSVGYLPQDLTLEATAPVAALLGIDARLAALRAIEGGSADPGLFDIVGDDWDIAARARGWLDRLGLAHVALDDLAGRLSGGEVVMTALAALLLRRPDVLLLDEPTNNLDVEARRRLYDAVREWPGVMLIVSHDRSLLELVDQVADLSGGSVRMYGGSLGAYEAQLAAEQGAAARAVSAAQAGVRREKRDLVENQVKQARRDRQGRKAAEGLPPIVASARKRSAQETAGKNRQLHAGRLAAAQERLASAREAVRGDPEIRVDLPGTAVPAGRTVLTVTGLGDGAWRRFAAPAPAGPAARPADAGGGSPPPLDSLIVRGPEHLALTGPNGAGKTTLLRIITGELAAGGPGGTRLNGTGLDGAGLDGAGLGGAGLTVRCPVPAGYLPQRLDVLDGSLSVARNVRRAAPSASVNEVRAGLARFLFRGSRADQLAGSLSGGERFRAVLACLLLATPPPQLLLLDEPTNSLDLASTRQLAEALACYRGALIIVSHDLPFLRSVGITRWLWLDGRGQLTEAEPPALPAGQDPGRRPGRGRG
jgi:ATPase subunit of ABC transporter with duplicated ATPase domains